MQFNPVLMRSNDATNIMHFEKERNAHPSGSQAGRRSAILYKSAPNQHHIDLLPAKHVIWAFLASFPWAPHASRTSARERPPHASGPAPLDESSFPRAPSERAPRCASPCERERERARASSPRDRADAQMTRSRLLPLRACGRPEEAAPPHAACALPAPTSCASSLVSSRARASLRVHGRRRLPPRSRVCLRVGNEPVNEKFTRDYG
jgi:hypothetical protein